jgi:anhydro-N-acetylmuramic acid kinase
VATLTAFTAASILVAYDAFLPPVDEVVVSGGGARNRTLLAHLSRGLTERGRGTVVRSDARGVDPDFKEAVAFALLGWAFLRGVANTVPEATGARRAVVAGALWPGGRKAAMV